MITQIQFKGLRIGETFNGNKGVQFTKISPFAARHSGLRDYNAVNIKTGWPTTFLAGELVTRFVRGVS